MVVNVRWGHRRKLDFAGANRGWVKRMGSGGVDRRGRQRLRVRLHDGILAWENSRVRNQLDHVLVVQGNFASRISYATAMHVRLLDRSDSVFDALPSSRTIAC